MNQMNMFWLINPFPLNEKREVHSFPTVPLSLESLKDDEKQSLHNTSSFNVSWPPSFPPDPPLLSFPISSYSCQSNILTAPHIPPTLHFLRSNSQSPSVIPYMNLPSNPPSFHLQSSSALGAGELTSPFPLQLLPFFSRLAPYLPLLLSPPRLSASSPLLGWHNSEDELFQDQRLSLALPPPISPPILLSGVLQGTVITTKWLLPLPC